MQTTSKTLTPAENTAAIDLRWKVHSLPKETLDKSDEYVDKLIGHGAISLSDYDSGSWIEAKQIASAIHRNEEWILHPPKSWAPSRIRHFKQQVKNLFIFL